MVTSRNLQQESPLRSARRHHNWTLEDVVARIDARAPGGGTGVTPSLLSSWERGKIKTSLRYRQLLCDLYELPPEVLFAHQDQPSPNPTGVGIPAPRVLRTHGELLGAMIHVVRGARHCLAITGSRSRGGPYLQAVEAALAEHPDLVHYRVLYGPPHHRATHDHLLRLLELRDPAERTNGVKTLHIGLVDPVAAPERFIVSSDNAAVLPVPSLTTAEAFDTGLLLGADAAVGLVHHVREAYAGARRVETIDAVRALPILNAGG
ncbi:helix-turn-helix transcriptional regulator [Solwaraspora sp. WMMD1047]|uniref:helix-turn-helix domain-containing protein n=1 Tax=Solwaraspora sp. WMMD1047 TaxID=3016102 RepID=UPI002415F638|nr:helix-turn-helix transcriptional regulator [Solwaraspora sp. WMMD1047]MDG4834875.1 helix-turn-helix transcriptional regulator [Solwaraspora sp. WMMD1047]MDG4834894.1 helix-turn-helix transcriptional regulator [Solwaraspora sp. WMMD1047]